VVNQQKNALVGSEKRLKTDLSKSWHGE